MNRKINEGLILKMKFLFDKTFYGYDKDSDKLATSLILTGKEIVRRVNKIHDEQNLSVYSRESSFCSFVFYACGSVIHHYWEEVSLNRFIYEPNYESEAIKLWNDLYSKDSLSTKAALYNLDEDNIYND